MKVSELEMENPWVAFKLSSPQGVNYTISVYEGEGTGNRAHYSARLLGTLSESYDTYEEATARLNELNRGLEVGLTMNEETEQDTDYNQDLLWLIDKDNISRKYYLVSVEDTMAGFSYEVTISSITTNQWYISSGPTLEEAIASAIEEAQVGDALLAKYGQ